MADLCFMKDTAARHFEKATLILEIRAAFHILGGRNGFIGFVF